MLSVVLASLFDQHGDHPAVSNHRAARSAQAVHLSHRWQGRAVLVLFTRGRRHPWLVVKIDRDPRHQPRLVDELTALERLDRQPAYRGLVPAAVGMIELPGAAGLVQTGLPGSPLTAILRRRGRFVRRAAERDHARAHEWLGRFRDEPVHGAPTRAVTLDRFEEQLQAALPEAARNLRWVGQVTDRGRGLGAVAVQAVHGHGDLGPSNMLVHRATMRLIDWEGQPGPHSPLPDAFTFVNHYARATPLADGRLPSRQLAIERALLGDDGLGRLTRRSWRRILSDHGVDPALADVLAMHTLVELATGRATTAHGARGKRMWSDLLQHVATVASERPETWRTAWATAR